MSTSDSKLNEESHENENSENVVDNVDKDPYKLKNAEYIKPSSKYKNKQKILVFGNKRISQLGRNLLKDLKALLPHHKPESKWDSKSGYKEINELCELNSCTGALYLESRKNEMIMWMAKTPKGPTLKSRVTNIHTLKDSTFTGNCLARSRPLLTFDKSFSDEPYLKLIQKLFSQILGTPNNHPKSMPFHDHCLSFFFVDNRIHLRHYQISPKNEFSMNSVDNQVLDEIGPQFVLEPILILDGSFSGITLWRNSKYISPLMVKRYERQLKMNRRRIPRKKKVILVLDDNIQLPEDELSISNVFSIPDRK
uniref:Brix domain containing protein, putative n=1 Tax=Theileria annulata TaxID=5874 RepID=A0A3B0N4F6_THEAN